MCGEKEEEEGGTYISHMTTDRLYAYTDKSPSALATGLVAVTLQSLKRKNLPKVDL